MDFEIRMDCCGGEPKTSSTCSKCGCREAGNASYVCPKHYITAMDFDSYFLEIAKTVSLKSKDPSSKIGAVIVGPEKQIISTGYNGFARGIDETDLTRWERPLKYKYVEHAERNSVYNAARHGIALRGCTMYFVGFGPPTVPCTECAKAVIQAGITRVVGFALKEITKEWVADLTFAKNLLLEAGIEVEEYKIGE